MQVYRLHGSEPVASPVIKRVDANGLSSASSSENDAQEGVSTDAGSGVSALLAQLRQSPEVRQAVVEHARAKIAAGEYFTRSSAEATAEALLRHES
jgi:hypothetical protein